MSGHSKWHNIQKTKGAADAKRSAAFTKIAKEIIVAVKQGGSGDPNNNSRLATVIAKAKAANMPNDNIKRTIDKALGSGNTDNYESVTYEGYGPGAERLVDGALDVVVGHVHRLGLGDYRGQAGVVVGVPGPTGLHRHDDLLGDLRKGGAALGIRSPLGLLNIMPFGMS